MTSQLHIEGGTLQWKDPEGRLHRDNDKPAAIYANGSKAWWQHGELHRDHDMPAGVYANGDKCWYQHGEWIRSERAR